MSEPVPTALPGCVLRPWRAADRDDLIREANNRKVWRNMTHTFPHPYTQRDADVWLAIAADPGASIQLAIDVDGRAVGGIGVIAGEGIFARRAMFG
jgi:ribosomal-protein-alanine N-acetyltransferase